MAGPLPFSSESIPAKVTRPRSWRETAAIPGSSPRQAVHQDAKKSSTTGWPCRSAIVRSPEPLRRGSLQVVGWVDSAGGSGAAEDARSATRTAATATATTTAAREARLRDGHRGICAIVPSPRRIAPGGTLRASGDDQR